MRTSKGSKSEIPVNTLYDQVHCFPAKEGCGPRDIRENTIHGILVRLRMPKSESWVSAESS